MQYTRDDGDQSDDGGGKATTTAIKATTTGNAADRLMRSTMLQSDSVSHGQVSGGGVFVELTDDKWGDQARVELAEERSVSFVCASE